ncbi:MAG: hypothetical protein K6T91_03585 [Firmicutes bacterium]|nr:hypothetical protein [Bacillota bacterium]
MSERKTTLKVLGLIVAIGLIFAIVAGCSGGQGAKQANSSIGPKVLFFHSDT